MEKSESGYGYQSDLNLKATELRLGLPGSEEKSPPHSKTSTKRAAPQHEQTPDEDSSSTSSTNSSTVSDAPPVAKAQIVGWPPVRSYRKNANLQTAKKLSLSDLNEVLYLKVSMDGAPYLRKIDVKVYRSYPELLEALQKMFSINIGQYMERQGYIYDGSEYAPTYEDKDGDWMLVGDVPWEMFVSSCKKLRIIKASEAKGLRCL